MANWKKILNETHTDAHPAPTNRDTRNQIAGTYNAIIGTDTDLALGATEHIAAINVTDGVITSMSKQTLSLSDLGGAALASPTFTGTPIAPTAATSANSTQIATTAFVKAQNYATGDGDITSVVAGSGMTDGGTSGALTLNVVGGTGITANADDIAITAGGVDTTQLANDSVTEDKLANALLAEIDANTLKETNVTQTSVSGNAGTVTTNANMTGHVTSVGNATSLGSFTVAQLSSALSNASISGNNTGDQTTVSGNAGTVTNGVYTTSTIAVNKGGTGATANTGTAGSNVLSVSPALTGTASAENLTVSGDLTVSGTTITTNTETLNIADNTLVLNSDNASTSVDAGIVVQLGSGSANNANLWFDVTASSADTTGRWVVGSTDDANATIGGYVADVMQVRIDNAAINTSSTEVPVGHMQYHSGDLYVRVED